MPVNIKSTTPTEYTSLCPGQPICWPETVKATMTAGMLCACFHKPLPRKRVLLSPTGCTLLRLGLEPENAAEPAVDVIHEGSRQLTRRLIQVCLVKGNQGGDVDD